MLRPPVFLRLVPPHKGGDEIVGRETAALEGRCWETAKGGEDLHLPEPPALHLEAAADVPKAAGRHLPCLFHLLLEAPELLPDLGLPGGEKLRGPLIMGRPFFG